MVEAGKAEVVEAGKVEVVEAGKAEVVDARKAELVEAGWAYIALEDVKGVLEALRSGAITNTSVAVQLQTRAPPQILLFTPTKQAAKRARVTRAVTHLKRVESVLNLDGGKR